MDGIYLTFREKWFLFTLRFKNRLLPKYDVSKLISYGLIDHSYTGKPNKYGAIYPDKTYCLTDFAIRYRIAMRQDRWKRIITPVIVSVVTNLAMHALQGLLQKQ